MLCVPAAATVSDVCAVGLSECGKLFPLAYLSNHVNTGYKNSAVVSVSGTGVL